MAKVAWGIDVATTGIKFVKLGADSSGGWELLDCAFFPLEGDFGPEWAPRLKAFLNARKMKVSRAVVALGGKDMVLDITSVPRAPDARLQKMMELHVAQYEERMEGQTLSFDWTLLRIPTGMRDELITMIGMGQDAYLDGVLAGLQKAGIGVASFTPAPAAVLNTYTKFGELSDGYTYLIDIGEKTLSLALIREGAVLFARNMQTGLDMFIEPLMGALEVKRQRAVRYLVEEGKVGSSEGSETLEFKAGRALQTGAEQLTQVLSSSIKFCQVKTRISKLEPSQYILSGGGARLNGLAEFIATQTRKDVLLLDTSDALTTDKLPADALENYQDGLTYAIAVGAAQVAADPAFSLQIVSRSMRKSQSFYSQTLVMMLAVAAAGILLMLAGFATNGQLQAETRRDQELSGLFEQYTERKEKLVQLDLQRKDLEKKLLEINRRVKPGSRYFRTLSLIQRILPEPMWLKKIQLKQGKDKNAPLYLEITGVVEESSLTLGEVESEFLEALKADPVIARVELKDVQDMRTAGRSKFVLEVHYK